MNTDTAHKCPHPRRRLDQKDLVSICVGDVGGREKTEEAGKEEGQEGKAGSRVVEGGSPS